MVNVAVLGSTGSIGLNTLEVIRNFPGRFRVIALSANSNNRLLESQIKEFKPRFACSAEEAGAIRLKKIFGNKIKIFTGAEGLKEMAGQRIIDKVAVAISGAAALPPLLKAIECGKEIALANKEALVMAGPIILKLARKNNVKLIPIDSEQSAIWQCLEGEDRRDLKNIYLTASGGPFRNTSAKILKNISVKKALRHPRWKMGRKISVDSATLMNKGLELLEAVALFGVPAERIKVLIHPQAIIHSMVEFVDGVILAQLSATDMRIPIQYALSYPKRLASPAAYPAIDFYKLRELNFLPPDFRKFPCLMLAYQAAEESGTAPAVLNAANEISVHEFLKGKLGFLSISLIIEKVLQRHRNKTNADLKEILQADDWARQEAYKAIGNLN